MGPSLSLLFHACSSHLLLVSDKLHALPPPPKVCSVPPWAFTLWPHVRSSYGFLYIRVSHTCLNTVIFTPTPREKHVLRFWASCALYVRLNTIVRRVSVCVRAPALECKFISSDKHYKPPDNFWAFRINNNLRNSVSTAENNIFVMVLNSHRTWGKVYEEVLN